MVDVALNRKINKLAKDKIAYFVIEIIMTIDALVLKKSKCRHTAFFKFVGQFFTNARPPISAHQLNRAILNGVLV